MNNVIFENFENVKTFRISWNVIALHDVHVILTHFRTFSSFHPANVKTLNMLNMIPTWVTAKWVAKSSATNHRLSYKKPLKKLKTRILNPTQFHSSNEERKVKANRTWQRWGQEAKVTTDPGSTLGASVRLPVRKVRPGSHQISQLANVMGCLRRGHQCTETPRPMQIKHTSIITSNNKTIEEDTVENKKTKSKTIKYLQEIKHLGVKCSTKHCS